MLSPAISVETERASLGRSAIPELDTFRGVAAILMVINHAGFKLLEPDAALSGLSGGFVFSGAFGNVAIKMGAGNNTETIGQVESLWKRIYPEIPFGYYFLDDGLKATYANESRISKIYTLFCSIALFIACMGLFALASYTIQKRLKEISVRKVLGASASSIIILIYRDFLLLILIAFLIATPLSIIVFNNWLSTFAYRIAMSPLYFLISVLVVIIISWLTLAFQMIRASRVNPAVTLKSE